MPTTPYELEHIDERADKEILELITCAVVKYQVTRKRVPMKLRKKHMMAIKRYCDHLEDGSQLQLDVSVEKGPDGKPIKGGYIRCRAITVSPLDKWSGQEDDDDEEDDEW